MRELEVCGKVLCLTFEGVMRVMQRPRRALRESAAASSPQSFMAAARAFHVTWKDIPGVARLTGGVLERRNS